MCLLPMGIGHSGTASALPRRAPSPVTVNETTRLVMSTESVHITSDVQAACRSSERIPPHTVVDESRTMNHAWMSQTCSVGPRRSDAVTSGAAIPTGRHAHHS